MSWGRGTCCWGLPLVSWCPGHSTHHSGVTPWLSSSCPREAGCCSQLNAVELFLQQHPLLSANTLLFCSSLPSVLPQDPGTSQRVTHEALLSWPRPEAPGRPRAIHAENVSEGIVLPQRKVGHTVCPRYSELRRNLTQRPIQMTGIWEQEEKWWHRDTNT